MNTGQTVVLASASPRRRELLSQLGIRFEALPVDLEEDCTDQRDPADCVRKLALEKARAALIQRPDSVVIGSDTLVVLDDEIFGKPRSREQGMWMLESLSGRAHDVVTGVAIVSQDRQEKIVQRSIVTFAELQPELVRAYWETGEPRDKAGAYAIQGLGAVFIRHLQGSYSGVMGLPLYETALLLSRFGVYPPGFCHE